MILSSDSEFVSEQVGSKAVVLQTLMQAGYTVLPFVVIPVSAVESFSSQYQEIIDEVHKVLSAQQFAVRSAALTEDTMQSSMAGQFLTKLNIPKEGLVAAVQEVIAHAQTVSGFTIGQLSIIIQEYVEPDYAGVLFTRNPLGGREMVVNYTKGVGEQVVSGGESDSLTFFGAPTSAQADALPPAKKLYQFGKEIEGMFGFAQDIEWAFKGGTLYVLQSRPITTLSKEQYAHFEYLDTHLPKNPFLWRQTSITETFSRPTPLAFSALYALYKKEGPIQKAYQTVGVSYVETEQFKMLGNQLYVDMQAEAKTTLPALGFVKHESEKPRVESLAGLWRTIQNSKRLNRISTDVRQVEYEKLVHLLTSAPAVETLEQALHQLDEVYQHIFNINLRCQLALSRLTAMAGSAETVRSLLDSAHPTLPISVRASDIPGSMLGNSISIDDRSEFSGQELLPHKEENVLPAHWKLKALTPKAIEVQNWVLLRGLGRWLSVRLISDVREQVYALSAERGITADVAHFATVLEYVTGLPAEAVLRERKELFHSFDAYTFPATLASFTLQSKNTKTIMLSPGQAEGTGCTTKELSKVLGSKILLVQKLTPDLTQYFDAINGIVCTEGGLLSHLAIMAREAQIPVVLSANVDSLVGKTVLINHTADEPLQVQKED